MSLSRFEARFIRLEQDRSVETSPAILLRNAMAMLADLAADTPEPEANMARGMLTASAARLETLFGTLNEVTGPLASWRRSVTLYPADDGRQLRCYAIHEAERVIRALSEPSKADLGDHTTHFDQEPNQARAGR